jgi:hypothetical protein
MFYAVHCARVQIAVGIFFERQAQSLGIELAARRGVPDDWAETGDE